MIVINKKKKIIDGIGKFYRSFLLFYEIILNFFLIFI
jgi:hypothetical protein